MCYVCGIYFEFSKRSNACGCRFEADAVNATAPEDGMLKIDSRLHKVPKHMVPYVLYGYVTHHIYERE